MQAFAAFVAARTRDPQHGNLLDVGALQIVSFQFIGVDVFSVRENDDFFLSSGDKQVPAGIQAPQVARMEPILLQYCCRSFEILVVAFHHDRPADSNVADAGAVSIDNLELYAWQSGSHGADNVVFHACDRGGSRRFSEAVALENGESQIMKILGHIQVKGRSATDEEPELAAERAMDLGEEQLAKIKTEQAQRVSIEREHCAEECSNDRRFLPELVMNPAVKEVEELRNRGQDRDSCLLERFENLRAFEGIDEGYFGADVKRQKKVDH